MIGATGGTGASITEELVRRGIHTIAFGRSRQKLEQFAVRLGNPAHLTLAVGDAMKEVLLERELQVLITYHRLLSELAWYQEGKLH
ncbi:hypothetical protein PAEVO_16690 [Paenibacillus sp. GM2FR]|nr:hypothetical protein PAEVO_16690 [Paenibacillus sp. GM2FR]